MTDPQTPVPVPSWRVPASELQAAAAAAPDWLISDLLPSASVVVLAGTPGVGKSMTALSWAGAVATGRDWYGHKVRRGPVVYVLGEGWSAFGRRVDAWESVHGSVGDDLSFIDGAAHGVDLANPASLAALIQQLVTDPPVLVFLDTFAMLSGVNDENSNSEVGRAMRAAHQIVQAVGCSVVLVHHVSKGTGQVRGATAFRGNADAVIVAGREERKDDQLPSFFLSTRGDDDGKQRDGEAVRLAGFSVASPGVLARSQQLAATGAAADALAALGAAAQKA